MNEEEIRKIIEGNYDDSREGEYFSMAREFFSKKMRWVAFIVYGHFAIFIALAIIWGVLFYYAANTKDQIMYASFFICSFLIAYLIKVFAWIMVTRNTVQREIKRLELGIAELTETVKNK